MSTVEMQVRDQVHQIMDWSQDHGLTLGFEIDDEMFINSDVLTMVLEWVMAQIGHNYAPNHPSYQGALLGATAIGSLVEATVLRETDDIDIAGIFEELETTHTDDEDDLFFMDDDDDD